MPPVSEWHRAAVEEVRQVLAEDPNFAYAHYLQAELGEQHSENSAISGVFAVAFVDAMKREDADRFRKLETMYPGHSELLDVARAFLFEDRAAANRAVVWLNTHAEFESRRVSALRGFIARHLGIKMGAEIADGSAFLKLVGSNDNIRLDLIETALIPGDLALAA